MNTRIAVPAILLGLLLLVQFACNDKIVPPPPDEDPSFSALVTVAGGGTVTALDGTTVSIPANAVPADVTVRVQPLSGNTRSDPDVKVVGRVYRMTPDSLVFSQPIAITLRYSNDQVPAGAKESDLCGYYFDGLQYASCPSTIDEANNTITITTIHFTDFVIAAPVEHYSLVGPEMRYVNMIVKGGKVYGTFRLEPLLRGPDNWWSDLSQWWLGANWSLNSLLHEFYESIPSTHYPIWEYTISLNRSGLVLDHVVATKRIRIGIYSVYPWGGGYAVKGRDMQSGQEIFDYNQGTGNGFLLSASEAAAILGGEGLRVELCDASTLSSTSKYYVEVRGMGSDWSNSLAGLRIGYNFYRHFRGASSPEAFPVPTANALPNPPGNPTPSDGAEGVSNSPTLSWSCSDPDDDPLTYDVYLGKSNPPPKVAGDISGTHVSRQGLSANTTYFWSIVAKDAQEGISGPIWRFKTAVVTQVPPRPTLVSPEDNASFVLWPVTFTWNASNGATGYQLQVSKNAEFTSTVLDLSGITGTSQQLDELVRNTTYFWRVKATNSAGDSEWSSIWTFTSWPHGNRPPYPPENPSPENNATNLPTSVTLGWTCSDPEGDAVVYDVFLGKSDPLPEVAHRITSPSYTTGVLEVGATYYWQVKALDIYGRPGLSPVWKFATASNVQVPSTPTLLSPTDNATGVALPPTLAWNPSTGAVTYTLQVSEQSSFGSPLVSAGVSEPSKTVPGLAPGITYYWRVRATNAAGPSPWSTVWKFTTANGSNQNPDIPSNPVPANLAINQPTSLTLTWDCSDPDGDPLFYDVFLDTEIALQTQVATNISDRSFPVSGLLPGTTYYWLVNARDSRGGASHSDLWRFTTSSQTSAVSYLGVSFADVNRGIVVGQKGTILRTTNGGMTWTSVPNSVNPNLDIVCISFVDGLNGTAVGLNREILRTTDGGSSWTNQTNPSTGNQFSVSFVDANRGMIVGRGGEILSTSNGGATWAVVQQNVTTSDLRGVCLIDESHCIAVGLGGSVVRSTDGGIIWTNQTINNGLPLYGVSFSGVNSGTAVGVGGTIVHTSNGGTTWINQRSGTSNHLFGVSFSDEMTGTVVGDQGTILRTTDGGGNWILQSSGTTNNLTGVSFSDVSHGTTVGWSGTILRTTDGGATWIRQ